MIIGLTGYAQSGKDTVANILVEEYGYTRVAFANPIKELLYEMDPLIGGTHHLKVIVDSYGWEVVKQKEEVRRMLQNLGVGARKIIDDSIWVSTALRKVEGNKIVFTDVRFENEASILTLMGGQIWRVKRPGVKAVNSHVSESSMDDYKVDQIITNNGTLEDLHMLLNNRMQYIKTTDIYETQVNFE